MSSKQNIILLFLVSMIALYIYVGSYGVVESSDARYAEIAREMYQSGDYVHPNLLNVHHYHKPPLTYQITTLGYRLFGVNPFAARFFLQIAILIQLLLVYTLSVLLFNNKQTARWALMIYFSFPIVLVSSRNLTTDAFLTTFVLLSITAWVKYRKSGLIPYLYVFTLSLALGFLTKGPLIFIVPLIFILAYNTVETAKQKIGIHHFMAWFLFLGVAFSWFIYLGMQNTDFFDYFLGRQTVDRFSKNAFNRTEPFWYFLLLAPFAGLPWLFILPYLMKQNKKRLLQKSIYLALCLGIFIPLLFFSISSSKRILYILPFYSLLAILIAQFMTTLSEEKVKTITKIILGYAIFIVLIFIVTPFIKSDVFFPKSLSVISIIFITAIITVYNSKTLTMKSKPIVLSFMISLFLLPGSSYIMSYNQLEINSSKPVTDFIIDNELNNRNIFVYNTRKPSLAFGLNKSILSLNNGNRGLARETQFEQDLKWKNYLIDMKNNLEIDYLKQLLKEPSLLIIYKHPLPVKNEWLLDYFDNNHQIGKWTLYY